jgi:hypothetical protein
MKSARSTVRGTDGAAWLLGVAWALAVSMPGAAWALQAASAAATSAPGARAEAGKGRPANEVAIAAVPEGTASAAQRLASELEKLRRVSALPAASRVGITLAMIALMGGTFYGLFKWEHAIEQSDFFPGVCEDAAEKFELTRLAAPIDEKCERATCLKEICLENIPLGRTGVEQVEPRPACDRKWQEKARDLAMGREIDRIERGLWPLPDAREGTTANPFAGGSRNARPRSGLLGGLGGSGVRVEMQAKLEADPDVEACREALRLHDAEATQWVRHARAQARDWYQTDLAEVKKVAAERAMLLLDVDFSALRGRGPEFVLEFTAVVVIIFAALVLGVLGVLDSHQIGTLLAAIAGYVLGKATSRNQAAAISTLPPSPRSGPDPTPAKATVPTMAPAAPAAAPASR